MKQDKISCVPAADAAPGPIKTEQDRRIRDGSLQCLKWSESRIHKQLEFVVQTKPRKGVWNGDVCSNNLRHALTSFLVEIGIDPKTIQDMLRCADPSILLKVYTHSRMDKRLDAQAKMIAAMGLNEHAARRLIQ
ncbi:MAG TPA: hypothetical protein VJS37_05400 [Terriglobales bacterium]|nr:hypothetical protein [Terriglobales bacterium]